MEIYYADIEPYNCQKSSALAPILNLRDWIVNIAIVVYFSFLKTHVPIWVIKILNNRKQFVSFEALIHLSHKNTKLKVFSGRIPANYITIYSIGNLCLSTAYLGI